MPNTFLMILPKSGGGMLFDGATSFWETLIGSEDFNGAGSLCHGWSAIPVYLYLKYAFKDIMKGE